MEFNQLITLFIISGVWKVLKEQKDQNIQNTPKMYYSCFRG